MAKINLYKTSSSTEVALPKEFAGSINSSLLAQAIHVYRNHMHSGRAMVKTRAEVVKTTAKVYRQKGTGFARHGARTAPIYVGGGKAHGPRGARKVLALPVKMRRLALVSALATKAKLNHVCLLEVSNLTKTREAGNLIDSVRAGQEWKNGKLTLVLSPKNFETRKALSNLERVNIVRFQDLNAFNVMFGGKLVFDNENFAGKKAK